MRKRLLPKKPVNESKKWIVTTVVAIAVLCVVCGSILEAKHVHKKTSGPVKIVYDHPHASTAASTQSNLQNNIKPKLYDYKAELARIESSVSYGSSATSLRSSRGGAELRGYKHEEADYETETEEVSHLAERENDSGGPVDCGIKGLTSRDGRSCRCITLLSGRECKEGTVWEFQEPAQMQSVPSAFLRDIVMSKEGLKGVTSIKVNIPGKVPPWREIGKPKAVEKLVPDRDPVGHERYETCAVVGNSGVLLHSADTGAKIDAHDLVLRFNGAPTKGLEQYVGSRTDLRLVNSKWTETREGDEFVLWNMRAPGALDFYKERISKNRSEKFYMFTADFVTYVGQTAEQMALSFTGAEAEGFTSDTGYTPTSGFTGLLIALNLCHKVTLFGMQISEKQGFPYHYHNRCPQPYAARDEAEWLIFRRMVDRGLAVFNEPCIPECREGPEVPECARCRAAHPELYSEAAAEYGRKVHAQTPLPDYCKARVEMLRREREDMAKGLPAYSKEKRDKVLAEINAAEKEKDEKKAAKEERQRQKGKHV